MTENDKEKDLKTPVFKENVDEIVPITPNEEIFKPIQGEKKSLSKNNLNKIKNKKAHKNKKKAKQRIRNKMARASRKKNRK
jgi:hypothetical protein